MSAIPPIPGAAPPPAPAVASRRCVRHPAREAAARCPACGRFYCRECVVEHAGRLLCTSCLAKAAVRAEGKVRLWPRRLRRAAGLAVAVLGTVFAFYLLGSILLRIPPEFHEGSVWSEIRAGER